MCCACACTPLAWGAPPRKTTETPPCMALPRRASHAIGSPTGRRSSPGGRRSWGRGRGRPVCRSLCVHTWGTPFSCLQASTIRRDPFHIAYSGRHGARGSCHPTHARACARVSTCLVRRRTLPPQLRVAELKFVPAKCRPHLFQARYSFFETVLPAPDSISTGPVGVNHLRSFGRQGMLAQDHPDMCGM